MSITLKQLQKLSSMRFSSKEVTLKDLLHNITSSSGRFILKRSTQTLSAYLIWDTFHEEYALCTHSFVVRYATPLDTGNFCPDGAAPPMDFKGQMRKSEPSMAAQVSLTFDAKVEPTLHETLSSLEEWGTSVGGFPIDNLTRNHWNTPQSVANQGRFTVSSALFQRRTGFNVVNDRYTVPYDVHPWIANACVPHNPSWIPNPNLARFMHRKPNNVLVEISESKNPKLVTGDVVVMTFKIVFNTMGTVWQMAFVPIQVIRMGQIDPSAFGAIDSSEDHSKLELPKPGERLRAIPDTVQAAARAPLPEIKNVKPSSSDRVASPEVPADDASDADSSASYEDESDKASPRHTAVDDDASPWQPSPLSEDSPRADALDSPGIYVDDDSFTAGVSTHEPRAKQDEGVDLSQPLSQAKEDTGVEPSDSQATSAKSRGRSTKRNSGGVPSGRAKRARVRD